MLLALLVALQGGVSPSQDSMPQVTLTEALQRAAQLDPNYVSALGQVDNAVWGRRNAFAAFILPAITLQADAVHSNPPGFNFVTFQPQADAVTAQVTARYDLFTGGGKLAELSRSGAALESARASELRQRFQTAFDTESDYYAVLENKELERVARDRLRRANESFAVARARVASGAAVQTDSLNLLLERTRAQVALMIQQTQLRVARLQLGRRVGLAGPADAAPLDSVPMPELPLGLPEAISQAAEQGPQYRVARANERAARANYRARLGDYLPRAAVTFNALSFDNRFFPQLVDRTTLTLTVSYSLWNGGQRELALSQARVNRDVARAIRQDMDRAVQVDVAAAYDTYVTARATTEQARLAVVVARESFRVEQTRYSSGATTILDLLASQGNLALAEGQFVQAQYAARLALAGLESVLGRRLFTDKGPQ